MIVDNGGQTKGFADSTSLRGIGLSTTTALEANTIGDTNANFAVPNISTGALGLKGLRVDPLPDLDDITGAVYEPVPETFTITDNTLTTMTTDPADGDMTLAAAVGDEYVGVHILDNLTVTGQAKLSTPGDIYVMDTVTLSGGTISAHNVYEAGYWLGQTLFAASLNFDDSPVMLAMHLFDEERFSREFAGLGQSPDHLSEKLASAEVVEEKELALEKEIDILNISGVSLSLAAGGELQHKNATEAEGGLSSLSVGGEAGHGDGAQVMPVILAKAGIHGSDQLLAQATGVTASDAVVGDAPKKECKGLDPIYTYDLNGNRASMIDPTGVTNYSYDALNRLTSITNPAEQTISYTYDALGRRTGMSYPNGISASYSYDAAGRLTSLLYRHLISLGPAPVTEAQAYWSFDEGEGNVLTDQVGNNNGTIYGAAWDENGRYGKALSFDGNNDYVAVPDDDSLDVGGGSFTISFWFMRRASQTTNQRVIYKGAIGNTDIGYCMWVSDYYITFGLSDGSVRKYLGTSHSGVGNWSFVAAVVDRAADSVHLYMNGNYIKSMDIASFSGKDINSGHELSIGSAYNRLYFTGLVDDMAIYQRALDADEIRGRYQEQTDLIDLASFSYTYDAVGNRLSMVDEAGTHSYTYDEKYQLVGALHPSLPAEDYSYDAVGNRNGGTYDAANRLLEDANFTYAYDNNGNTTEKVSKVDGEVVKYTWNAENQLTQVEKYHAGESSPYSFAKYIYDGMGRRVAKNVDNIITKYLYDNEDILLELNENDEVIARYTHGPGIDEPLIMERNGQTYYYITDGLGSVVKLVDAYGAVVNDYVYDSFGNIASKTEGVVNVYTYTGREYDTESGLYYYRARYYDSNSGRFLNDDPVGFAGGVNFYSYVKNNPINWVDPWGLKPLPDCVKDLLYPYFENFDLNKIEVYEGIPWHVSTFAAIEPGAYTSGTDIYLSSANYKQFANEKFDSYLISLLGHEVTHSKQYSEDFLFASKYLLSYLNNRLAGMGQEEAYIRIPFEEEAYGKEIEIHKALKAFFKGEDPCANYCPSESD